VVFIAVGVGYFAALLVAGAFSARLGRQALALGALVVAAGCLLTTEGSSAGSALALLPGLAVVGFGIGLVLVPLSSTVLAGVDTRHAGAASGVLSTAQQVGGALGVAVIGVVFFNSLGAHDFQHAFTVSLSVLAALTVGTAALVQLLPRPAR
jgi:MFS family permease